MTVKRRGLCLAALVVFLATPAAAQRPGQIAPAPPPASPPVQQQVPGYITAKPDSVLRAFGQNVASKIFSSAYTPIRVQAVQRSQQSLPGFQCPADPQVALASIIPYPVKPGAVSWIERYVVACNPRTVRNFLMLLEGEQPRRLAARRVAGADRRWSRPVPAPWRAAARLRAASGNCAPCADCRRRRSARSTTCLLYTSPSPRD